MKGAYLKITALIALMAIGHASAMQQSQPKQTVTVETSDGLLTEIDLSIAKLCGTIKRKIEAQQEEPLTFRFFDTFDVTLDKGNQNVIELPRITKPQLDNLLVNGMPYVLGVFKLGTAEDKAKDILKLSDEQRKELKELRVFSSAHNWKMGGSMQFARDNNLRHQQWAIEELYIANELDIPELAKIGACSLKDVIAGWNIYYAHRPDCSYMSYSPIFKLPDELQKYIRDHIHRERESGLYFDKQKNWDGISIDTLEKDLFIEILQYHNNSDPTYALPSVEPISWNLDFWHAFSEGERLKLRNKFPHALKAIMDHESKARRPWMGLVSPTKCKHEYCNNGNKNEVKIAPKSEPKDERKAESFKQWVVNPDLI